MNSQMQNRGIGIILFASLTFFLGLFWGSSIEKINPTERVAQIVSCSGYEEDFLKVMGFRDRDDCKNLNLGLYNEYFNQCLKEIKTTDDEKYDRRLLDFCVYYSFEKDALSLSAEYMNYKNKK